jgi:hypothetical protein
MLFIAVLVSLVLAGVIIYSEPIGDEWEEDPWKA